MAPSVLNTSEFESPLEDVIADYLQASGKLNPPNRDKLRSEHPDLADELEGFFSDHDWMVGLANPAAKTRTQRAEAATFVPSNDARRYVDLRSHAHGGLGEVFSATDCEFNRVVALKRLQERFAHDQDSQRRFLMEAEITARLEHPGVVPVHSMFQDNSGRPSYVMRFIEGDTLADAIAAYHADRPDPVVNRRLLQSFVQVCQTISYAHSRGIIHRDLKPQNIMLGKFGETLVVDWGLAKVIGRTDEDRALASSETLRPVNVDSSGSHETQMGSAVGTPAYMSPEQAAGRWDVIGTATDVYGLGAVLYVLLTGRPPLESGNWPAVNQRIQRGDFPRPRELKRSVPGALEAVCLKALAVLPEDRYPSAEELANDVECWLADEPVQAYREPVTKRLGRWARRHKPVVAVIAAIIVAAPPVGASWMYSLEQADAETLQQRLNAMEMGITNSGNMNEVLQQRNLFRSLEEFVDWFPNETPRSTAETPAEIEAQRGDLLRKSIAFWDEAIQKDEGFQTGGTKWNVFYRIHRAQCLAHLGESDAALAEATELARDPSRIASKWVPHLVRVYAIILAGDREEQQGERLAAAARDFFEHLAHDGYFEDSENLERLRQDPQLEPLLSRKTVGTFLDSLKANSHPTFPN